MSTITEDITVHLKRQAEKRTETHLRALVSCAIKTGRIAFITGFEKNSTIAYACDIEFDVPGCGMENMDPMSVRRRILEKPEYRRLVEIQIAEALSGKFVDEDAKAKIIKFINDAYIKPDNTLHLCIGFYENGDFKTNTVMSSNLPDNIEYNRFMRPGRYYYVDGEYVCGGMVIKEKLPERIATHKERIKNLGIRPDSHDSAPYV